MVTKFDRLEYGKICESERGPILNNAEAHELARSFGFPTSVAWVCAPRFWGLGDDPAVSEAAKIFGATVLVSSLLLPEGVTRIGAAFRRRSELGEGKIGREYWRARFLCSGTTQSDQTDLALLTTRLTDLPMLGWTHADIAEPIALTENTSDRLDTPLVGDDLEEWCALAAKAVEKRIPVGLKAPLGCSAFFALARALEQSLHWKLRPVFNAGWGIAPTNAAHFALSCCIDFQPDVAVYDCERRSWLVNVQTAVSYRAGDTRPQHSEMSVDLNPRQTRLLFLTDVAVERWVASVHFEAAAERLVNGVRSWLDSNNVNLPFPIGLVTPCASNALEEVTTIILSALQDTNRIDRGEIAFLEMAQGPIGQDFVKRLRQHALSSEVELLLALRGGDTENLLAALTRISGNLGPWAQSRLVAGLDASLVPVSVLAVLHATLLVERRAMPQYTAWAIRNAPELALIISSLAPEDYRERAVCVLGDLSDAPEVLLIRDVLCGEPREIESRLNNGLVVSKPILIQLAKRRWGTPSTSTALDRSAALCCLRAMNSLPDDVLLRDGFPSSVEIAEIATALREACVPEELLDLLAQRTLRFWSCFEREVKEHWPIWECVLDRWPIAIKGILVPQALASGQKVPSSFRTKLITNLEMPAFSADKLETIGRNAARRGVFEGNHASVCGKYFLELCLKMRPPLPPGSMLEIVSWLWNGGIRSNIEPSAEVTATVAALLRQIRFPEERIIARWRSALTSKDLLLLLRLFRRPIEEPTVKQLEILLLRRRQIAELIKLAGRPKCMMTFEVCTLGWQSIDIRNDSTRLWRPEYRKTMISGIFSGLSHEDEASFNALFGFFEQCSGQSRWELAWQYLLARGGDATTDRTKDLIWEATVKYACSRADINLKTFDTILRYSEGGELPKRPRVQMGNNCMIVPIIQRENAILLHPCFARLLRELGDRHRRQVRLDAYRGPVSSFTG